MAAKYLLQTGRIDSHWVCREKLMPECRDQSARYQCWSQSITRINIIRMAISKCLSIFVDWLQCSISIIRTTTAMAQRKRIRKFSYFLSHTNGLIFLAHLWISWLIRSHFKVAPYTQVESARCKFGRAEWSYPCWWRSTNSISCGGTNVSDTVSPRPHLEARGVHFASLQQRCGQ